jgi:hypothetical protein
MCLAMPDDTPHGNDVKLPTNAKGGLRRPS